MPSLRGLALARKALKALTTPMFLAIQGPQWASASASGFVYIAAAVALNDRSRGVLALSLDLAYLFVTLITLGRGQGLLLYSRNNVIDQARLVTAVLRNGLFFGAATAMVLLCVSLVFPVPWILTIAISITVGTSLLAGLGFAVHAATSQPALIPVRNYLYQFLLLAIIITLVIFRVDGPIFWLLAYSGAALAFIPLSAKNPFHPRERGTQIDQHHRAQVVKKSLGIFPNEVMGILEGRGQRLSVAVFLGLSNLGIFVLQILLFELIRPILNSWLSTKQIDWAKETREKRAVSGTLALKRTFGISLAAHVASAFATLPFLVAVGQPLNTQTALSVGLLAIAYFAGSMSDLMKYLFYAASSFNAVLVFSTVSLLIFFALSALLSALLGVIGIALALLLSKLIAFLMMFISWHRG